MSDHDEIDDLFTDPLPLVSWHKQDRIYSEEEIIQRQLDFQNAFRGDDGRRVMGQILSDLCFFRRCEGEEEVALNNYAKKLLSYFGDWEVGSVDSIISKLLNI